jgi:hypothetical protein
VHILERSHVNGALEERRTQRLTYFFKLSRNMAATSRPSVLGAPKPFVQRMSSP